jgi:hypothetical protein
MAYWISFFVIVLKEMQVPYTNYFEIFPYKTWSLSHYEAWVFKHANKRSANITFYKALNLISRDQQISKELCDFSQELLKKQKVSSIYFI